MIDDSGRGPPVGNPVRNPPAVGPVTVVFTTTAATPAAGTPPVPTTFSVTVCPGSNVGAPRPRRVSINRVGCTDWNKPRDAAEAWVVLKNPATSTTKWVAADENNDTFPPAPTGTITRFATSCPRS